MKSNSSEALPLSDLQISILRLVAKSRTSKQIAVELNVSHHTVDTYVWSAMRTLGVSSRSEAAKIVVNPPNINSGQFIYEPERVDGTDKIVADAPCREQMDNSAKTLSGQACRGDWRAILGLFHMPPVGGRRHDLNIYGKLAVTGRIAFLSALFLAALATVISGSLHLLGR